MLGTQRWMDSDTHAEAFMGKKTLERAKNLHRSCLDPWEEWMRQQRNLWRTLTMPSERLCLHSVRECLVVS